METTTKRTIKTWLTYKLDERGKAKITNSVSETVPDDTYSVKEILQRFTRGQKTGADMPGVFYLDAKSADAGHDSPDYEKVSKMDLVDRNEVAASERVKHQKLTKKAEAEAAEARKKESEEKELQDSIKNEFLARKKSAAKSADSGANEGTKGGKE